MSKEKNADEGKAAPVEAAAVAVPLPRGQKRLVEIGCVCMMLSVSMYGLAFSTLTAPILANVQAGVNLTFLVAGVVSFVGLLVVLLVVRPQLRAAEAKES